MRGLSYGKNRSNQRSITFEPTGAETQLLRCPLCVWEVVGLIPGRVIQKTLHVCPGEIFGLQFGHFLGKKLSIWLSACSVLIVVPLLLVRPSFSLVSCTEGVR